VAQEKPALKQGRAPPVLVHLDQLAGATPALVRDGQLRRKPSLALIDGAVAARIRESTLQQKRTMALEA
jgi:hypothetical protein